MDANESHRLFPLSWEEEQDQLRMAIMMSLQEASGEDEKSDEQVHTEASTSNFRSVTYRTIETNSVVSNAKLSVFIR